MNFTTEVLFEEIRGLGGDLGVITLNRPGALNSLNLAMIQAIYQQLNVWEQAGHIKAVVVRAAEGRAFCAGGDLRSTFEQIKNQKPCMARFFRDEYQLNGKIYHYSKPYIALWDGITMGGGVGISIHGSHRIATDKLLFAMPETGIGFFPDVGGSYFLPRLPGRMGHYLGLTGTKLTSDDCVQLGIATHKIAAKSLTALIHELAQQAFVGEARQAVSNIIAAFQITITPSALLTEQQIIQDCFAQATMEDIVQELQHCATLFCQETLSTLAKKSPTSLKVTLKALQEGEKLDFDACMRQEYRLVSRFLKQHDFVEGIRAVIIDKDQSPHWQPATLQEVSTEVVAHYFAPLEKELV